MWRRDFSFFIHKWGKSLVVLELLVKVFFHPKKEWENGFLRMEPENREAENYSSESAYH